MGINTNVYGAQNTWLNALNLSTGAMVTKCANFTGGNTVLSSSSLGVGNTASKTPHNTLIERSISLTALGTESIFSHITYWKNSNEIYTDNEIVTEFYFCTNDNSAPIRNTSETIYTNSATNFWKTYNATNNNSDILVPITEMNPKKILYILQVLPVNANGEPAPFISGLVDIYRFISIGDYANNVYNIRTDYPYIQAARLMPRVDNSNTTTPSRSALSGGDYEFGMAINREFTAIPDDNLKINYCQFINIYDKFNIPLWGHRGYFNQSADYNVILANPDDIQTGVIDYSREYWVGHLWDNDFYDYLIRQAACFGVFVRAFAGGGSAASLPLNNDNVILGLLDDYGIGHGDYTRGSENEINPIFNWSSYSQSPYDYTKEIPSDYDDSSHFNSITLASCNKVWVASYNEVEDLVAELYKGLSAKPIDVYTTDYSVDTYLSTNAIDGILSVRHYPLIRVPCSDTVYPLTIGAYTSNDVTVRKFVNAAGSQFIDFKFSRNKRLDEAFGGSFLDREPYTTAELYIPFCGTVPISIADYIGHDITVKLAIDYKTGSCTAYILKDSTPLQSANGQIGVDIPVSGLQSATLDGQLLNANLALKQSQTSIITGGVGAFTSAVGSVASVVGGGKFGLSQTAGSAGGIVSQIGAVSSAIDRKDVLAYELHHQETPVKTISAGSPTTAAMGELCCRLTIYRPILSADYDPEIYAKTVGFACLINGKVRDFSGLTLGIISLDGVNATAEEKQLIATAFKQGVFL